jgi:hypothetical protein
VLLSQFEATEAFATERVEGRTRITRVSEIENIQDLLKEYATGSLYIANLIAPQGDAPGAGDETTGAGGG